MAEYTHWFDFTGGYRDEGGQYHPDPPNVVIRKANGTHVIQMLEDPIPLHPDGVKQEDWELGPLAKKVLALLNGEVENG